MDTFDSFIAFVKAVVLPRQAANPDHIRLDGRTTGGNWDVAGRFVHEGRVWTVYDDSHYEPLLLAYGAARAGKNPFVEVEMEKGPRLDLTPDLQAGRATKHRYLYIYERPATRPS